MRSVIIGFVLACLAPTVGAQTFDPARWPVIRHDTGYGGTSWKLTSPSGPSDWFDVRVDGGRTGGFVAYGILAAFWESAGQRGRMRELALRTSNAAGDPDVRPSGLVVAAASADVEVHARPDDEHAWSCPPTTLGPDVHVCATWFAGDSNLWIPSDRGPPSAGRSYWSLDGYATPGNAFSPDWVLGIVGLPSSAEGSLLVNGASSASVYQGDGVCLTFTACQPGVASVLVLVAPIFASVGVPLSWTTTGNPFTGGPLSTQWTLCATTDCNTPVGGPFGFSAYYLDPCDRKPNGQPRAKLATTGGLTIGAFPKCNGACFGQKDDGQADGTFWAVQNYAGPSDYFNVDHGSPSAKTPVSFLIGMQVAAWNTGSRTSSWATVGIYPDNPALPGSPDLSSPFGVCPSPRVVRGSYDTSYPARIYHIPPIAASTTTTYHAVVRWRTGESDLWVASDTTGDWLSCADPLTGANTSSGWTSDGYATPANYMTNANWMMKIDWL